MMDQKDHPLVPFFRNFVSSPQAIHHLIGVLHQTGEVHLILTKPIKIGCCTISPLDDQPLQIIVRQQTTPSP